MGRLLIAAVVLSFGWSAVAFGASNMGADCDHSGADFLRSGVEVDELSVSVVDLTADKDTVVITAAPDDDPQYGNSAAPLLFLTARVESIVDDVFGTDDVDVLADRDAAEPATTMTPLAEIVDEPVPAPTSETVEIERAFDLRSLMPSIQRQMYRTDI